MADIHILEAQPRDSAGVGSLQVFFHVDVPSVVLGKYPGRPSGLPVALLDPTEGDALATGVLYEVIKTFKFGGEETSQAEAVAMLRGHWVAVQAQVNADLSRRFRWYGSELARA